METARAQVIHMQALVGSDKRLHLEIDVPCDLPEGPAEVTVAVESKERSGDGKKVYDLRDFIGIAKGLWEGVDAQDYVNELRDEWESRPS